MKTIGDEAMLAFASADQAAAAAAEIQMRMTSPGECGVPVAFRIGFHLGTAIEAEGGDVFGDGVNVAARMVALAKRGQVILSATTAHMLSAQFKPSLREIDVLTVKGKQQDIGIVELVWDHAELTALITRPGVRQVARLTVRHGARVIELDETTTGSRSGATSLPTSSSRTSARRGCTRASNGGATSSWWSIRAATARSSPSKATTRSSCGARRSPCAIAAGSRSGTAPTVEGSEFVEFDCG